MDQTIRKALDALVLLQEGLSITDPIEVGIAKAWKYFPPQETVLPDTPAILNAWSKTEWNTQVVRFERRYTIHMQLFIGDADDEQAADIATAFDDAFDNMLTSNLALPDADGNPTVNGGDTNFRIVGDMPAILERAGNKYVGLDMFLDVIMTEGVEFS